MKLEQDELITKKVAEFLSQLTDANHFRGDQLAEFMEPVMIQAGRREPKPIGERMEILIIRNDAAGDFVLFSPVLREIRRLYAGARITLLVSPRNGQLAELCPYVDEVITENEPYNPEDRLSCLQAMERLAKRLRANDFDLAFMPRLGIQSPSLVCGYLSGARERIAFSQDRLNISNGQIAKLGWDKLLTVAVPFPAKAMHDVDRDLYLLEYLLRGRIVNRSIEVWYSGRDAEAAWNLLQPLKEAGCSRLYAVAPAASIAMKRWPVERYITVLRQILEAEPDVGVVLLGGPEDKQAALQVEEAFGKRTVRLTGEVNFRVSAAALGRCELYIGDDTGLMHIAAAHHLPVLSVNCWPAELPFAHMAIPIRFTPYDVPNVTVIPEKALDGCQDNWQHGCSHMDEVHCIKGVTPEAVLAGYQLLKERIAAGNKKPMYLKS